MSLLSKGLSLLGAGSLALLALGHTRPAEACILTLEEAAKRTQAAEPRMASEKVLIYFDEANRVEELFREIHVAAGTSTFGFLVPLPGKPTVTEYKGALFSSLQSAFPYPDLTPTGSELLDRLRKKRMPTVQSIRGTGMGIPANYAFAISEGRVGSFTVAVLEANDAKALTEQLNQLEMATLGAELTIDLRGRAAKAVVVPMPFYKRSS